MLYLIDTNILITAHKITNPIDIHPTYWEKLKEVFGRPDVLSIDKVKDEIFYFEDDLSNWCKENIDDHFWKSSENSIQEYAEIQNWASNKNYNQRALVEFADYKNADPYLVAFALQNKRTKNTDITIVTLEVSAPESKKNVKLPDVCTDFQVQFLNNNDFFRAIGISF